MATCLTTALHTFIVFLFYYVLLKDEIITIYFVILILTSSSRSSLSAFMTETKVRESFRGCLPPCGFLAALGWLSRTPSELENK